MSPSPSRDLPMNVLSGWQSEPFRSLLQAVESVKQDMLCSHSYGTLSVSRAIGFELSMKSLQNAWDSSERPCQRGGSANTSNIWFLSLSLVPQHILRSLLQQRYQILSICLWLPIVPFTLLLFPQLISKWFRCWCCDLPLRKTILSEPLKIHPTFQ